MFFSWYFIGCLLGITALALFVNPGWFLWYGVIVLFMLWGLDALLAREKNQLSVTRELSNPCYQKRQGHIKLVFTNHSPHLLRLIWKDAPPFLVQAPHPGGAITLAAGACLTAEYDILPMKRGRFEFGVLNLRYNGPLSLFTRQMKYPLPGEIIVYPDLSAINTFKLARLVPTELEGLQRRRLVGMGGELTQLREYVCGDDYRKINWKVSAHHGKPVVNEFEPEKDQNVFLLFDAGRLLFDQVDSANNRFDHVLDSAILLAYQVLTRGDLVGALSFHYKIDHFLPAGKGHAQLRLLIDTFFDQQAWMVESNYREAFRFWQQHVNKRSLLFVYTDLLDPESSRELCNYLQIISRRHIVVCVLTRQKYLGEALQGTITDEKSAYRKGIALEFWEEREKMKQNLIRNHIKVLDVNPGSIRRMVVEHYLFLKERGLF